MMKVPLRNCYRGLNYNIILYTMILLRQLNTFHSLPAQPPQDAQPDPCTFPT